MSAEFENSTTFPSEHSFGNKGDWQRRIIDPYRMKGFLVEETDSSSVWCLSDPITDTGSGTLPSTPRAAKPSCQPEIFVFDSPKDIWELTISNTAAVWHEIITRKASKAYAEARRQKAIALLRSWREDGNEKEDYEDFERLCTELDRDRTSSRKLFSLDDHYS